MAQMTQTNPYEAQAMVDGLAEAFNDNQESQLSFHSTAMTRGETEGGLQIPRFIVLDRGGSLAMVQRKLKVIPVEGGETGSPYSLPEESYDFSLVTQTVSAMDNANRTYMSDSKAQNLVERVAEAEPLAIDYRIARLLLPYVIE